MDVIELNEAFAAQALAVTRDLGCPTMPPTSTLTAARSPWAIRSVPPAAVWR
jgi:acetyl-CoA acetyltransferase